MITPTACECKPCERADLGKVKVKGQVLDRSGKVPLRFGQVWMDGEVAAETDIVGAFDIQVRKILHQFF